MNQRSSKYLNHEWLFLNFKDTVADAFWWISRRISLAEPWSLVNILQKDIFSVDMVTVSLGLETNIAET